MSPFLRRWLPLSVIVLTTLLLLHRYCEQSKSPLDQLLHPGLFHSRFRWRDVPQQHPVDHLTALPQGPIGNIPRIQHVFPAESETQHALRQIRLRAVKTEFQHAWRGYKKRAWLQDEVGPLTGKPSNTLGGWGATLVDSLDSLWIMGMKGEFEEAVSSLRKIDFTINSSLKLNVFETTIRYLGGLLSAYDLSGHQYPLLLEKAIEIGDMLYVAFDTPNRMPIMHWDWKNGVLGGSQSAPKTSYLAEIGSLTLEFTRLSQLTGDNRWYDAVARIMDAFAEQQNKTWIPGLWPVNIDTEKIDFTRGTTFTFGGLADSIYEYLPKQHLLLGHAAHPDYETMYLAAVATARKEIFFRPLNQENRELILSGTLKRLSAMRINFEPESQHLTCFAGGMVALGAKAFNQPDHLAMARQLVDGCFWAYESMPSGIMPETFITATCEEDRCDWSEQKWYDAIVAQHQTDEEREAETYSTAAGVADRAQEIIAEKSLPPGFVEISDARYHLRPEAIESMFILYRTTGDESLRDKAWTMFETITTATKTDIGHAGVKDVTATGENVELVDTMESFWTGETLKYFYLMFSDPEHVSLDNYVFNTEAHPFLRPKNSSSADG